jgi:HTH-type transcriptional regulator/antitoxin HipB
MKKNLVKQNNKSLKVRTFDEVFAKSFKSPSFQKEYNEELVRLRLAHQIKQIRIEKKLTQKEVAVKAKMPQSVIARMESGSHSFSLGTLGRVAKVFNKEVGIA